MIILWSYGSGQPQSCAEQHADHSLLCILRYSLIDVWPKMRDVDAAGPGPAEGQAEEGDQREGDRAAGR